jgi:hypothetical protein
MPSQGLPSAAQVSAAVRAADRWWVGVPLLAFLLISPTLLHGRPFLFYDTEAYYYYGGKLIEFALAKIAPARDGPQAVGIPGTTTGTPGGAVPGGPVKAEGESSGMVFYGSRSPFYSVWFYSFAHAFGLWAVLLTQAAVVAAVIWRVATHAFDKRRLEWAMGATALATFGASAWFPLGFVMPDAFAPVALASVAALVAYGDQMSRSERLGMAGLLAIAAMFHVTHLAAATIVAAVSVVAARLMGGGEAWLTRRALVAVASALVLAVVLQAVFDVGARMALGATLKRPPFVMARIIADGPGRRYLDQHCTQGGNAFAICAYRERNLTEANDFLWSGDPDVGVFQTVPPKERLRLIDEELRFVAAVALSYPLDVLKSAAANTFAQFILVSPGEAYMDPGAMFGDGAFRNAGLFAVAPFLKSCVDQLASCVPKAPQGLVSALAVLTVLLALGVIAIHVLTACRRATYTPSQHPMHRKALIFAGLIVIGLVANAALCGAISGLSTRYQVRVAWLAVIAAAVLEAAHPILASRVLRWNWR